MRHEIADDSRETLVDSGDTSLLPRSKLSNVCSDSEHYEGVWLGQSISRAPLRMTTLRLLADDLTGALDTAAAFVPLTGDVPSFWVGSPPDRLPGNAAIDAATRELSRTDAVARHHALAGALAQAGISFKKIDSLLRGHTFAEIAACFSTGLWRHVVLAPAFPFQGRVTRGGCQFRLDAPGGGQNVGDLVAAIQHEGLVVQIGQPGERLAPGVTVFDAEIDTDLQAAVRRGLTAEGRVLWCGSAGLAQALVAVLAPEDALPSAPLRGPVLGLFGSDQDVTAQQIANCAPYALRLGHSDVEDVITRLTRDHAAMISFDLPENTQRDTAATLIHDRIAALLPHLPKPGTLVVAGGETLRAICDLLGAHRLDVTGSFLPGVPRSIMRGGAWDGVDIISKSGAFGAPTLLCDLLHQAGIAFERTAS